MTQTDTEPKENPMILVVDDQTENLQLLGQILQENNYRAALTSSGREALNFTSKTRPDLILLDIMMPRMDGFHVCQALKANEKTADIPVIFLTARTQTEDLVTAFKMGGVDYIIKPFNRDELLSRIRTHVQLKLSREIIIKQNQELVRLNEEKNQYLSVIAHDLRNPVSVIFGFARIIQERIASLSQKDLSEYVGIIRSSSENMEQIISKILELKKKK